MNRVARIAVITGALTAIGSVLGAAAGAAALWIAALASADLAFGSVPILALQIAAVIGGVLGAAALPLAAWLLLRHVALGLIFVLSAAGTIVGGVVGWLVPLGRNEVIGGLRGAVLGFVVSAVAMWLETRLRRRRLVDTTRAAA